MKKGRAGFTGFTLIEIVVTVGIIILFSGLAIPRYTILNQETKLRTEAKKLAEVMELAKKKAVTSELYDTECSDFNGYRVEVLADSYSLNFGCSGAYEAVSQYELGNNISITAGAGNFDFPPGGFGINITTSSIRLKSYSLDKCSDISITPLGIITVSESLIGC